MGCVTTNAHRYDIPYDPDDFGRCFRLLEHFPEWKKRLPEVAAIFPKWEPMVAKWEQMSRLYVEEKDSGHCSQLYALMRRLVDEGRRCDGWTEVSPGHWIKGQASSIEFMQA